MIEDADGHPRSALERAGTDPGRDRGGGQAGPRREVGRDLAALPAHHRRADDSGEHRPGSEGRLSRASAEARPATRLPALRGQRGRAHQGLAARLDPAGAGRGRQAGARHLAGDLVRRARRSAPSQAARAGGLVKRLALVLALAGCAHRAAQEKQVTMDPIEFHATKQGTVEIVDPAELFAEAGKRYADKQYKEAGEIYDRVAAQFAESRFVTQSLYNAGLCLEAAGDLDGAADRYRKLIARGATGSDAIDAQYRLGGVYERARNWAAAGQEWAEILDRKDLTLSDRVEAMSRRGVAQFNLKDLVAAERTFRETQRFFQDHQDDERLDTSYFLAMSAYYIGQVAHEEYRLLPVRLPEKQMAQDLENKARMLMTAQTRYLDAMKVNNGEWATAAGFQIASLYREFYDDLVGAPIPPELTGEAREVYLE